MNTPDTKRADFEAAALTYLDDLFRTATAMTGNRTEAEDLVQQTYLEAWKSFHRFELGTNCRAWLFKILIHRVHHYRRRWYRWTSKSESDDLLIDRLTYEEPVPETICDEDVLAALKQLPEMFREILMLADVQEFSYKEISSMLEVPIGTVMSRLSRARKRLKESLLEIAPGFAARQPLSEGKHQLI